VNLDKVVIKNFRSVEHETINFVDDRAQILVGINESGKSNILKALSLLSDEEPINPSDKRVERHDEEPVNESYVYFLFSFSDEEMAAAYASVSKHFLTDQLSRPLFLLDGTVTQTLKEFCDARKHSGLYWVSLSAQTKSPSCLAFTDGLEVLATWKKIKSISEVRSIRTIQGNQIGIPPDVCFLSSDSFEDATVSFESFSVDNIFGLLEVELIKIIKAELPKCIYWKYEEKNLLPVQVDMNAFAENPDSCLPLKNCFELANYSDVTAVLNGVRSGTRHKLVNLLSNVGEKTTSYLRSVWKDYKDVSIEFQPDGALILPIVKDKKINFDFQQRSDGFKRFVSFLLMISTKVSTDKIKNTLILIDEPEIGLHPTGARNLMAELIKISKSNYVMYSTHSIFMIDKDKVDRHIIVEKVNEATKTQRASSSKIIDEEVIYKAMGYSLLEILQPVNILFEGWRDKKLFQVSDKPFVKSKQDDPRIVDMQKTISVCHAEGVKDVRNIAPIIELSGRVLRIVSDSDEYPH